jgi:hypothetical protein
MGILNVYQKDCAFEITSQAYLCDDFRPFTRQKVKEKLLK